MVTLMPWNTVEIGDLDVFAPVIPSLVVYTWYVDDEPESSVTHFWSDDDTGMLHHELVFVGPITFEEAVTQAQKEAPKRSVKRIHVKHARSPAKPKAAAPAKRAAKTTAARAKAQVKPVAAKAKANKRKQPG